jgi:lysophospholipase L1-like esterase
MKNLVILSTMIFSLISCSSQSEIQTTDPDFDTNTLYPSANVVIPYHSDWTKTHYISKIAEFKANPLKAGDIVMVGNSITEQGGNWGQRFNNPNVKNRGIAGDVTAGAINRLAEIYHYKPKKVFLKIGINDLFQKELSPEYVSNNIKLIVDKIHLESPNTKIYVQTLLPTANNNTANEKIRATNTFLKAMTPAKHLHIIDLYSRFADKNDLMVSSYTTDGLHLTELGYLAWQYFILEYINN